MTKSIGFGKKNISITMTDTEKQKLEALADKSGMSRSEYCRKALREYLDGEIYFSLPAKKKS
jgi:metal-responsive CopG/Arc/MetJ family transcriptional regulator